MEHKTRLRNLQLLFHTARVDRVNDDRTLGELFFVQLCFSIFPLFKGNITSLVQDKTMFSPVWIFGKKTSPVEKQMENNHFHKCRSTETNYRHNSVDLNPEWTRTQDSDMRNKDWKCLEMLSLFSLTHKHTQRNVVPNRAAQGALMSVPPGMLSSPFPPFYSSLSIPLSFFLLFSSQFLTAGRRTW